MGIICCLLYLLVGFICSFIMLFFSYKERGCWCYIDEDVKVISALAVLFWFIIFPVFIFYKIVSWWCDFIEDFLRSRNND